MTDHPPAWSTDEVTAIRLASETRGDITRVELFKTFREILPDGPHRTLSSFVNKVGRVLKTRRSEKTNHRKSDENWIGDSSQNIIDHCDAQPDRSFSVKELGAIYGGSLVNTRSTIGRLVKHGRLIRPGRGRYQSPKGTPSTEIPVDDDDTISVLSFLQESVSKTETPVQESLIDLPQGIPRSSKISRRKSSASIPPRTETIIDILEITEQERPDPTRKDAEKTRSEHLDRIAADLAERGDRVRLALSRTKAPTIDLESMSMLLDALKQQIDKNFKEALSVLKIPKV